MQLPVMPPVAPMLAKAAKTIPANMIYEGKWDGFRAIIFRDGDDVVIGSRNEKPLTRYFPEVVEHALRELPQRCVVDGEIIIATDGRLDFEALLQRIHPAQSRVDLLAKQTPAQFVAFDLLALGDRDLMSEPFVVRRAELVASIAGSAQSVPDPTLNTGRGVHVAAATEDLAIAQQWFTQLEGAGLDGIVAKSPTGRYQPNKRAMVKIKHERTADVVVAGFRWHKSGGVVGSLLLGLYDDAGVLQQVGVCASFTMTKRAELVDLLEPFRPSADELERNGHPWLATPEPVSKSGESASHSRVPGAVSRWNSGRDLSWEPLRPELVVEVAYDHMQGTRFRHTAQFRRWRPDRDPTSCTYEQLQIPETMGLDAVFAL